MFAGLAVLLAGTLALAQDEVAQAPTDAELAADLHLPHVSIGEIELWRDFIRPNEQESRFGSVDWIPTFADGLRASAAQNKPLLFWAMNGHPLGCT